MRKWRYRSTILDLGTSWRWVASCPVRFTPGETLPGTHPTGGWVGPRTGLDDVEKRKFLPLPGLELRPLCRSARNKSLYRMCYPYSRCVIRSFVIYIPRQILLGRSWRIKWVGHIGIVGEIKICIENVHDESDGRKPLSRPRPGWEI
jgi:hypothetical protein